MKYGTIKELYEAAKNGNIDESKLMIIVDNDNTGFYIEDGGDDCDNSVCEGNGEYDVEELYRLLFPKAMVDRC